MNSVEQIRAFAPVTTRRAFPSLPGEPVRFSIGGEMGFRLCWILNRITCQLPYSREYLLGQMNGTLDGRRVWSNFPRFHGDICGRWILAQSTSHGEAAPEHLRTLVAEVLSMQNADGSFGQMQDDGSLNMHKAYGNGWMLKGLCAYAALFNDPHARQSAMRLGEHYLATFDRWATANLKEDETGFYAVSVSCYFHALDGIVDLYRLSDDARFLELAEKMAPCVVPLEEADHSHMYLTIRRGLLNLYTLTGNHQKIVDLAGELQRMVDQHVLETGGIPECFKMEKNRMDEGCSLFDWLLLCLDMHEALGEPRWLEYAQLNLENQIYYNQCCNGGFGSFELDKRYLQYGKEATWCCSLYGPFGLASCAAHAVRKEGDRLRIRLLQDGTYTFADGDTVRISSLFQPDESNEPPHIRSNDREARKTLEIDLTNAPGIRLVELFLPYWMQDGKSDWRIMEIPHDRKLRISLGCRLWMSRAGKAPSPCSPEEGSVLFYGPWMLVHRFDGSVPLHSIDPAAATVEHSPALGAWGEDCCVRLPAGLTINPQDVFSALDENSGTVRLYPLKAKESPYAGSPHVCWKK